MTFYEFARGLFRFQFRLFKWKVTGAENIPAEGPVILAVNHVSNWDPILVGCAISRQIKFMAKIELFRVPVLASILRSFGAFPVKRGEGDTSAIKQAIAILKQGEVLGIFPEGTRSKTGEPMKGQAGMVLIMERTKAVVVPIKVYGTNHMLSGLKGQLGLVIGKPLSPEELKAPESAENRREWIADYIMEKVETLPPLK